MQAVSNDIIQKKARLLYLLAKQQGFLEVSRDECAEMLAEESLSPELEQLWETQGKEQLAIVELNQCASRGNLEGLKVEHEATRVATLTTFVCPDCCSPRRVYPAIAAQKPC